MRGRTDLPYSLRWETSISPTFARGQAAAHCDDFGLQMMSNRKGVPPGAGAAATRTARRVMPAPARKTLATGLAREGKRPCCCRVQVDHARLRIALRPAPATSLQRAASSQTGAAASERRRKPGLPSPQLSWPHLQGQSSQDVGSVTSLNTSVTSASAAASYSASVVPSAASDDGTEPQTQNSNASAKYSASSSRAY